MCMSFLVCLPGLKITTEISCGIPNLSKLYMQFHSSTGVGIRQIFVTFYFAPHSSRYIYEFFKIGGEKKFDGYLQKRYLFVDIYLQKITSLVVNLLLTETLIITRVWTFIEIEV